MKALLLMILLSIPTLVLAQGSDNPFSIHSMSTPSGPTAIIRFNESTGETWYKQGGTFKIILDHKTVPKSNYRLDTFTHPNGWGLSRINTTTGQTWITKKLSWEAIPETIPETAPEK